MDLRQREMIVLYPRLNRCLVGKEDLIKRPLRTGRAGLDLSDDLPGYRLEIAWPVLAKTLLVSQAQVLPVKDQVNSPLPGPR